MVNLAVPLSLSVIVIILLIIPNRIFCEGPPKIVGGTPASANEFPYQVSLRFRGQHVCGGLIIRPTFILTAAHCILSTDPAHFTIKAGSIHLYQQGATDQERQVTTITSHPQYTSFNHRNDIAILELSTALDFNQAVNKINLPDADYKIFAGTQLEISGWGSTREGGSVVSQLRKAIIPAVAFVQCRRSYPLLLVASMICAGGAAKDTCQGDSGGPLATTTSPRLAIGVTSFGTGCGRQSFPGVYSRISLFRSWIDNEIEITGN